LAVVKEATVAESLLNKAVVAVDLLVEEELEVKVVCMEEEEVEVEVEEVAEVTQVNSNISPRRSSTLPNRPMVLSRSPLPFFNST